ncbi:hypothetical protein VFPFJ_11441 [Purpureocillium lilacinum]|uniref:Secreted protein n=1 Tax=Purpureocillium lilacinum TaxID=33203 RepID=A0A179F7R6_PURLI|nr:hypothetical protein VFPFJ_11441 [Purpureocillium lilacinum]OAQ61380.1 hypothetical protein VFPFJ_11441 [Purpureocillium lilacinum]
MLAALFLVSAIHLCPVPLNCVDLVSMAVSIVQCVSESVLFNRDSYSMRLASPPILRRLASKSGASGSSCKPGSTCRVVSVSGGPRVSEECPADRTRVGINMTGCRPRGQQVALVVHAAWANPGRSRRSVQSWHSRE